MRTRSFKSSPITKDLENSKFAVDYLEDALRDGMQDFLIALRNVVEARGGISSLAKDTHLGRESLYKTLNQEGTSKPYFNTIKSIIDSLGFEISIQTKKSTKKAA